MNPNQIFLNNQFFRHNTFPNPNVSNIHNMPNISNVPNIQNMPYIPNYAQLWSAFVNINYKQQQMMEMYYMKLFYDYQRFCSLRNLDYRTQYAYTLYYKYKFGIDVFPQPPNVQIQNNNIIYINEGLEEKLPRPDTDKNKPNQVINKSFFDPNLMNVTFMTPAGHRVLLSIPKDTTILQMCQMYMDRLKLPRYYIGNDVQFLYSAKKIDPFSDETVINMFKTNNILITVFDQGGVVGASLY